MNVDVQRLARDLGWLRQRMERTDRAASIALGRLIDHLNDGAYAELPPSLREVLDKENRALGLDQVRTLG